MQVLKNAVVSFAERGLNCLFNFHYVLLIGSPTGYGISISAIQR